MGQVVPSDRKRGKYDHKTLKEVKFHIGDYLVMNIRTPDGRGRDRVRQRDVSMEWSTRLARIIVTVILFFISLFFKNMVS